MNMAEASGNLIGVEGGERWGCKGGERKEKKKSTALKRKKNGSPEIETCGVNEMAKEGIKREQEGVQRMCKICRWHEIRRASWDQERQDDYETFVSLPRCGGWGGGHRPDKVSSA